MSKEVRYDDIHIVHVVIDFVMFTAIQKRFRIPDRFRLLSGRKGDDNGKDLRASERDPARDTKREGMRRLSEDRG